MLTSLQWRIATIVAAVPEAEGFALAGGGAMLLRGLVDRHTEDLDFFARRRSRGRPAAAARGGAPGG